ncbi:glycosyltransferase family 8 protein [Limimaricola sp.]|uniref:glycosyltransferase family 8 protein n=1 Tax=Limimaricola sp. TaxID=2211665 RepID=UPI004059E210
MDVRVESDRPARHRHAVVFCCDDNYLPYAAFAAAQIAQLAPERGFDIVICADTRLDLPAGLGLRHCVIDAGGMFDGFGLDARRTVSTYLRLAVPEALARDYDRILYLDSDVFVRGGDFDALLRVDLGGRPAAAVRDNQQWRTPGRHAADLKALGLPNGAYFNAGVMLIDVAAWREGRVLERALEFGQKHAGRMRHKDQTLLNAVLQGEWAQIAPVWNWQYTRASRLFEAMLDTHVVHFIGPAKPWADPEQRLPPQFAAGLARFMARWFPERSRPMPGGGPMRVPGALRSLAWTHLRGAGRTEAYLGRFANDLTVLP